MFLSNIRESNPMIVPLSLKDLTRPDLHSRTFSLLCSFSWNHCFYLCDGLCAQLETRTPSVSKQHPCKTGDPEPKQLRSSRRNYSKSCADWLIKWSLCVRPDQTCWKAHLSSGVRCLLLSQILFQAVLPALLLLNWNIYTSMQSQKSRLHVLEHHPAIHCTPDILMILSCNSVFILISHRTCLPAPMFSRNDVSIWSILKKCIGMVRTGDAPKSELNIICCAVWRKMQTETLICWIKTQLRSWIVRNMWSQPSLRSCLRLITFITSMSHVKAVCL